MTTREELKKTVEKYNEKIHICEAMENYGGGFVKALAKCIMKADRNNLKKLQNAFPGEWEKFKKMAKEETSDQNN